MGSLTEGPKNILHFSAGNPTGGWYYPTEDKNQIQINEVVETASLVPNDTCMYPNGRLSGKLVACDNPATTKIDGRSYCESHTGMVERGCLDTTVYEDGTTSREQMEARLEGRDPKPVYVYDSEADEWVEG